MKRSRGRGRRQQNPVNRSYDSNGPDVRVRGTASQVYEKYQALARDAMSAGDRVMAENYQQHAEHYYRILQSLQPTSSEVERDSNGEANNGEAMSADAADSNGAASAGSSEPMVLVREDGNEAAKAEAMESKSRRRGPLGKNRGGQSPDGASGKAASQETSNEAVDAALNTPVEAAVETATDVADANEGDAPVSAE